MDRPTFDELKDLAQHNPEGFEQLRIRLISDCIRRSSRHNQRRLRGLQFVIEARRRVAASPMRALLEIQAMMHESFLNLQQALRCQQTPCGPATVSSGRILQFRRSLSSAK